MTVRPLLWSGGKHVKRERGGLMSALLITIHFFLLFSFYATSLWFIYIVIERVTHGLHDGGGAWSGPFVE
jgi:hypothetical protein